MAWLTVIGPGADGAAQVDYRLTESAGCAHSHGQTAEPETSPAPQQPAPPDAQVDYRLDDALPLEWIGQGLADVGITAGQPLAGEAGKEKMRALMNGAHPETGEALVPPKLVVDPRGKLSAVPVVEALEKAAADRGQELAEVTRDRRWATVRAARLVRGVAREGDGHRAAVADLEKVAAAAGLDLDGLYDAGELATARRFADRRVDIRNRGGELTLEMPKSVGVLWALAPADIAATVRGAVRSAITTAFTGYYEPANAYGMRGHHGDGKRAQRVEATGLLGTVMWHDTARPVDGAAADPHLHGHIMFANLARADGAGEHAGTWGGVGAGGREWHRHVAGTGALAKALARHQLTQITGCGWERDEVTGAWEIAGIDRGLREVFSKRQGQIGAELGTGVREVTARQARVAAATSRQSKTDHTGDARTEWRQQADAAGYDPDAIVDAVLRPAHTSITQDGPVDVLALAHQVFDPETGVTAHRKRVGRADVLAAVCDALPHGVASVQEAEQLTDAVLAVDGGPVVELPPGLAHLTHPARYTSRDIVAAEQACLRAARDGYGHSLAVTAPTVTAMAITAYEAAHGFELSAQQRQVVERITTGGHGVDAVVGVAGAGKTTVMSAVRSAFEASGLVVAGAATAAVAAANLQAESGITSATIAAWLQRIQSGDGLAGVDALVVDEAGMADDRQLAHLLTAARAAGTKVILVGDPLQLRAVGVGGAFAGIHRQVDGPVLTENRRQRDPVERAALQAWRDGDRTATLAAWAQAGQVHAGHDRDDTLAALAADWATARAGLTGNVHDELAGLLMLAGTNADVDTLNTTARAIRRDAGEITGPDTLYRRPGGDVLALAVGDHVRVRKNDYRSRRHDAQPGTRDVLNGYRGTVIAIGADRSVTVEWRQNGETVRERLTAAYVAAGGVTHGTAMTVAAAQGLTCDRALVYGLGLEPNTLYPAMSRAREGTRLYLPRNLLEDDVDRARHGDPEHPGAELSRATTAFLRTLTGGPDTLVLTDLGREPAPIADQPVRQAAERARRDAAATAPVWHRRPHGRLSQRRLAQEIDKAAGRIAFHRERADTARTEAEHAHRQVFGDGPNVAQLHQRRQELQDASDAAGRARRLTAQADQLTAQARDAYQQMRELQALQAKGRIAAAIRGTTPAHLRQQIAELGAQAGHGHAQASQLRAEAQQAERQATAPYPGRRVPPGQAAADLDAITASWPQHLHQARQQDRATARTHAADAAELADQHTSAAAAAADQLRQLRAEADLRTALPAGTAHAEDRARVTYLQQQRQQAEQRRQQQHLGRGYRPPNPGPSHGYGL